MSRATGRRNFQPRPRLAEGDGMSDRPWDAYLTDADRAVLARGRFGQRMGFGARPAVVAIDCQRYMVGERGIRDERYPSSCGEVGWAAVATIASVLQAA